MFDYLISSRRKRSRGIVPLSNKATNTLDKLKNDLLVDPETIQEYQFLMLCKILASNPLSLVIKDHWSKEDVDKFVKTLKFLPELFKRHSKLKDVSKKRYHEREFVDILKALNNLSERFGDLLEPTSAKMIKEMQTDLIKKLKMTTDHSNIFRNNESGYDDRMIMLKYIDSISNEYVKKAMYKEFISHIAENNVRTLRADHIQTLFTVMDKYDLRNKDVLLNILPNLSTMLEENLLLVLQKNLGSKKLAELRGSSKIDEEPNEMQDQERETRHLAFRSYKLLFETFKEEFLKEELNLYGLSQLIVPIFEELSFEDILVLLSFDHLDCSRNARQKQS